MGGLISCQSECFNASSLATPWNSYRFAAEIYKLSDDRRQWIKMHPSILSITVRGQTTQNGQIAELDAMNLQRENVCKFSIHSHNEIKRCSDRFIYWKAQDGVYALNVISRSDVDNFCSLVASTSKTSQPTNSVAHRFHVQLAKLMSLRHETIVETESLVFTDGFLVIHPPDSLAFLDSSHNCMLCISMSECVISINEAKRSLVLSFPSRAFVIQFSTIDNLKRFCHVLLNESSMEIAGSRNRDEVISFLKQRLTWISTRIGAYKIVPSGSSEKTYPSLEWLYTLKYSLIYRIASMKELLPKPNLAVVVYPPDLRAKIPSTHFCHWVHIYASANENLAMKEYLQITCEKDISLDNVETQFSSRELSHIDTFDKLPSLPTCLFSDQKAQQKNISEERLYKSVVELVQTEEAFVTDLDKLINQYILPANLSFLEATEKLQKTHAGFLSSLRDAAGDLLMPSNAFAPLNYAQIKDAVMRISALFINKCNSFKVYSEYSAAYLRFQHLQSEDPLIKRRLSELNLSGQQRESIQSMLIKPIQRVLKYPLFLEQIRENCVKDSIEQKQCAQSLTRMQTLATYVNEMQRIYEEYGDELDQLAKSHSLRLDLRDLFMFAHLKWLNADEKYIDCVAFVFTNFIILLSESKKKVKPHRILPIWEIEINEVENTDTEPSTQHVFTIIHMNGREDFVYQIACCHPEIKMYFIKSVKKALKAYMRLKPRPISGSSQSDGGYGSGH